MKSNADWWLVTVPWNNNNNKNMRHLDQNLFVWFTYWYIPDVSETNAVTSADGLASAACKRPLERVQWGYNVTLVILIYFISPMLTQQYLDNFFTAVNYRWKPTGADVGKGVFFPDDSSGWLRLERWIFSVYFTRFCSAFLPALGKRQKIKRSSQNIAFSFCSCRCFNFTSGYPDVATTNIAGGDMWTQEIWCFSWCVLNSKPQPRDCVLLQSKNWLMKC